MAKIIESGCTVTSWSMRVTCRNCGAVLEVTKEDLCTRWGQRAIGETVVPGGGCITHYVDVCKFYYTCPECNRSVGNSVSDRLIPESIGEELRRSAWIEREEHLRRIKASKKATPSFLERVFKSIFRRG